MIDVQKLLGQFLGGQGGHGSGHGGRGDPRRGGQVPGGLEAKVGEFLRGPAGAAIAGGLATKLFRGKGLGRMGGSAMKVGGAAAVAGLAYKAWTAYQDSQRPGAPRAAPPSGSGRFLDAGLPEAAGTNFLPRGQEESRAGLMLSAMIAAAKADGYIDAAEQELIFGRLDEAGLDREEKGYLMDEMRRPLSLDELAARAGGPEEAVEIYTASVLAIDVDHPAERAYLDRLARRLALDPALVAEIHRARDEAVAD